MTRLATYAAILVAAVVIAIAVAPRAQRADSSSVPPAPIATVAVTDTTPSRVTVGASSTDSPLAATDATNPPPTSTLRPSGTLPPLTPSTNNTASPTTTAAPSERSGVDYSHDAFDEVGVATQLALAGTSDRYDITPKQRAMFLQLLAPPTVTDAFPALTPAQRDERTVRFSQLAADPVVDHQGGRSTIVTVTVTVTEYTALAETTSTVIVDVTIDDLTGEPTDAVVLDQ